MATKKASSKKTSKETSKEVMKKDSQTKKANTAKKSIFEEISNPSFISAVVLEFIGTFLLAASIISGQGSPVTALFVLAAIVLVAGTISGAHVNPLITVGAWATRRINTLKAVFYIVAQILGAMVAFLIINAFVMNAPEVSQQAALYGQQKAEIFKAATLPQNKEILVLVAEFIGSFIFAFSVAMVTGDKNKCSASKALGVGGALFAALIVSGALASQIGGSAIINPAVAFSLQAFTVGGQNVAVAIAVYIGSALLGGILGFFLASMIEKSVEKEEK